MLSSLEQDGHIDETSRIGPAVLVLLKDRVDGAPITKFGVERQGDAFEMRAKGEARTVSEELFGPLKVTKSLGGVP